MKFLKHAFKKKDNTNIKIDVNIIVYQIIKITFHELNIVIKVVIIIISFEVK